MFQGTSDLSKHRMDYERFKQNDDRLAHFSPRDIYDIKSIMKDEGIETVEKEIERRECH